MLLQWNDLNDYFWTNKSYQNIYQENLFWLLKSQKSYTAANNYISKLGETADSIPDYLHKCALPVWNTLSNLYQYFLPYL